MQFDKKLKSNLNSCNFVAVALGLIVGFICKGTENSIFGLDQIRTIGNVVLMLMSWLAIPFVFFRIIQIMSKAKNIKQHTNVIGKVIVYFFATSLVACFIGIIVALTFKYTGLFKVLSLPSFDYTDITPKLNFMMGVSNITVADLVDGMLKENMLTNMLFATLVGFAVAKSGEGGEFVGKFFDSASIVVEMMADFVVLLAPIGVFAMTARLVFDFRTVNIDQVFWLAIALLIGYALHFFIVYFYALKFLAKMSIRKFFKHICPAMIFAMTSTSSLASITISAEACDDLGMGKNLSGYVLPSGYIANMDGTVIYLAICTIYFATGLGVSLSFGQLMLMTLVIILTELGAAGVPHAGLVMLSMVMKVMGLDTELIMLVIALDVFFDIGRTCLNVMGDLIAVACAEQWCKKDENLAEEILK